jgi:iron(III) transport system permease protein
VSASPVAATRSAQSAQSAQKRALLLATILCLPALIPLVAVVAALFTPETEVWSHLANHVLPRVAGNTLSLLVGVTCVTGVLGTALAWLTTTYEFPGRRFFDWALLLPLAMPAYVLAFIAVGFLDFAGPLQTWLRAHFGSSAWVPSIRSTGGVIAVLSLAFYPYVYMLARSAFLTQGKRAQEAARTLGMDSRAAFVRVVLPMARPWIAAGVALVGMETLADFGAVSVFNYDTFTTAIYRAWFGMFSIGAALELAAILLLFVIAVFVLERRSRANLRFVSSRDVTRTSPRQPLRGVSAAVALAAVTLVFSLAFALPLLQLALWAIEHAAKDLDARYWSFFAHSLILATSGALTIVAASVVIAYLQRRYPVRLMRVLIRGATTGYAVPGTVLAIGMLVPIIAFNNVLQDALRAVLGQAAPSLLLQGTLLTVLLAYFARFLAVGFHPVESGLQRITSSIDEAAISLGVAGAALLRRVHVPLLRTSLATAAILVFVDIMKEMPITLIARPFGWDTLAVRVFEMTAEGEWERAALPSIAIVLVGLIPAALLARRGDYVA